MLMVMSVSEKFCRMYFVKQKSLLSKHNTVNIPQPSYSERWFKRKRFEERDDDHTEKRILELLLGLIWMHYIWERLLCRRQNGYWLKKFKIHLFYKQVSAKKHYIKIKKKLVVKNYLIFHYILIILFLRSCTVYNDYIFCRNTISIFTPT